MDQVENILTRRFLRAIHERHDLKEKVQRGLEQERTPYDIADEIERDILRSGG